MKYVSSSFIVLLLAISTPSYGKSVLTGPQVLVENETTFTVKHSKLGKNKANELAIIHCGNFGKSAQFVETVRQLGIASISTWNCQ